MQLDRDDLNEKSIRSCLFASVSGFSFHFIGQSSGNGKLCNQLVMVNPCCSALVLRSRHGITLKRVRANLIFQMVFFFNDLDTDQTQLSGAKCYMKLKL